MRKINNLVIVFSEVIVIIISIVNMISEYHRILRNFKQIINTRVFLGSSSLLV